MFFHSFFVVEASMKRISIKTFYLIAVISIGLIGLAVGSTYAMFTTSAEIDNPITINSNLTSDSDVMEAFEVDIEPYKTITKTVSVGGDDSAYSFNYGIWYINDVTDVDIGVGNSKNEIAGTLKETINGGIQTGQAVVVEVILRNNSSTKKTVTLGVAASKNNIVLASNMSLVPKTVLGERKINTNAASYITKLYSTTKKKTVTNNSITYNTSQSQLLMNDRKGSSATDINAGNIRYYGASPDNYVYFNCSDNSNPTSSTCEVWRIIGVFDGKVKIMRDGNIGGYSLDNKNPSTGAKTIYGESNWSDARLMKLLNPGYESETTGGSLYYNSGSGNCYAGKDNATITCNFTSTGIKNDTTRNMISESNWNLGGWNSGEVYANQIYTYEKGTKVYSGHSTIWKGKVAIPYASDYAYAAAFGDENGTLCNSNILEYNNIDCKNNNWLYNRFKSNGVWLLTPYSDNSYDLWVALPDGIASYGPFAYTSYAIYPTVYLNPDIIITTGEGTKDSPYKLKYDANV